MIKNTFIFLPGISHKKEELLWRGGICDWSDFLNTSSINGISAKRKAHYDLLLKKASKALLDEDVSFFSSNLPLSEHWRLYEYFKEDALFLDIEVTHVTKEVSVLGIYDGRTTQTFVKDINFDLQKIKKLLSCAKLIVTFNGNVFDLPFLKKKLGLNTSAVCFDARVLCSRLGLVGGLKEIEKTLGIKRENKIVQGLKGGDPRVLYDMWKNSQDKHYLNLLISYNEEDLLNLEVIANHVYKQEAQSLYSKFNSSKQ